MPQRVSAEKFSCASGFDRIRSIPSFPLLAHLRENVCGLTQRLLELPDGKGRTR